jgi:hypothetical protein
MRARGIAERRRAQHDAKSFAKAVELSFCIERDRTNKILHDARRVVLACS